ncbi:MAG: hypothetical protein J0M37_13480 [Ignavibacteria bacterium]|nr:hypothetical protein [Ignavibacteria bacterium]
MNSKIEVKLGNFSFFGEGEEKWVTTQLDKLLSRLYEFQKLNENLNAKGEVNTQERKKAENENTPLASFLKNKNATTNQNRKFLATAAWLHNKGTNKITTSDVSKALKDSNQSRLGNATECLNQNISKGFCEKEGKLFFVTEDGYNELN